MKRESSGEELTRFVNEACEKVEADQAVHRQTSKGEEEKRDEILRK